MKLYIMRHGEYAAHDMLHHNPLTQKGKEEIGKLASFLKANKTEVAQIFHSEQLRAKETAEIMANNLEGHGGHIEKPGLNPLDEVEAFLSEILTFNQNTLIVGHLPFVGKLISQLLHTNHELINFFPGTLVCLEKIDQDRFILNWILRPDLFQVE